MITIRSSGKKRTKLKSGDVQQKKERRVTVPLLFFA
jgi:hypothetical protein